MKMIASYSTRLMGDTPQLNYFQAELTS